MLSLNMTYSRADASYSPDDLVGRHGALDPGDVVADLGVDTGLVPLSTAVSPGHHTLQTTAAHHGATRVTLRDGERQKAEMEG